MLIQPNTTETVPPTFKLCRPYQPAGVGVPRQCALSGGTLMVTEHIPNVSQKAWFPPMTRRDNGTLSLHD